MLFQDCRLYFVNMRYLRVRALGARAGRKEIMD